MFRKRPVVSQFAFKLSTALAVVACGADPGIHATSLPSQPRARAAPADARATIVGFNEYTTKGVVIVAFPHSGDSSSLFETELSILRAASKSGPVMVMTFDQLTRAQIRRRCDGANEPRVTADQEAAKSVPKSSFCEQLENGDVRLVDANYDTPWIRDYGPQFGFTAGGIIKVIDAYYRDNRDDDFLEYRRAQVLKERGDLLEELKTKVDDALGDAKTAFEETIADANSSDDQDVWADEVQNNALRFAPSTRSTYGLRSSRVGSKLQRSSKVEREWQQQEKKEKEKREEVEKQAKRTREAYEEKLRLLGEEDNYLREELEESDRVLDDRAPFGVAQRVLRSGTFDVEYPEVYVDGGNLLRLPSGDCLTTEDLSRRNAASRRRGLSVEDVLHNTYGCKKVVFLRALPGNGVIEHVDMFALPANDKVLLASYDLRNKTFGKYLNKLDQDALSLAGEAALAMDENAARLSSAHIEVKRVLSPLPEMVGTRVVYRTMLNGLVRVDRESHPHAIVPTYDDYQTAVQAVAKDVIESEFGAANVDYVESSVSAKGQGAVHCLSLVAPLVGSVFDDSYAKMHFFVKALGDQDGFRGMWQSAPESKYAHHRFFITDGQIIAMNDDKQIGEWTIKRPEKRDAESYSALSTDGSVLFIFMPKDRTSMTLKIVQKNAKNPIIEELQRVGESGEIKDDADRKSKESTGDD